VSFTTTQLRERLEAQAKPILNGVPPACRGRAVAVVISGPETGAARGLDAAGFTEMVELLADKTLFLSRNDPVFAFIPAEQETRMALLGTADTESAIRLLVDKHSPTHAFVGTSGQGKDGSFLVFSARNEAEVLALSVPPNALALNKGVDLLAAAKDPDLVHLLEPSSPFRGFFGKPFLELISIESVPIVETVDALRRLKELSDADPWRKCVTGRSGDSFDLKPVHITYVGLPGATFSGNGGSVASLLGGSRRGGGGISSFVNHLSKQAATSGGGLGSDPQQVPALQGSAPPAALASVLLGDSGSGKSRLLSPGFGEPHGSQQQGEGSPFAATHGGAGAGAGLLAPNDRSRLMLDPTRGQWPPPPPPSTPPPPGEGRRGPGPPKKPV
jgi:hypothetical protein